MARKVTVIPVKKKDVHTEGGEQKKLRVAAYARVSSQNEDQENSFENQVEYYTKLITEKEEWEMAGIYADDGISGTGTKKRKGFMDMIHACENGEVDMVITKSISRFARNTADSLLYSRKLKNLGIPIVFQKEGVNTMDASGELMFTILSSLAQEESRNISENTQWGIRSKFQQGIPHINTNALLGYDKDEEGHLVINESQAEVVRRIYREFLEGWSLSEISRRLNEDGVKGVHGKSAWHPVSIERVLRNEKHVGDILMQKSFTSDFLTKTMSDNNGELEQYYIKDNHKGIVDRETWDAVQLELERRERFRKEHRIKNTGSSNFDPFYSKVFCGSCGQKMIRVCYKGVKEPFWKCGCGRVTESKIKSAVVAAWNTVVESREEKIGEWEREAASGDALQRYRARLLIAVTAEGKIENEVEELTRMFLEEVIVFGDEVKVKILGAGEIRVVV